MTGAALTDRERRLNHRLRTGDLDLELAWQAGSEPRQAAEREEEFPSFQRDTNARIPIGEVGAGDSGRATIAYRVCGFPADVWARLAITSGNQALASVLKTRVWQDRNCDTTNVDGESVIAAGRLADLAAALGAGRRIATCLGACEHACLGVDWSLSDNPPTSIAGDDLTVKLEFAAQQCTAASPSENPWT